MNVPDATRKTCQRRGRNYHCRQMKKLLVLLAAAIVAGGINQTVLAQADSGTAGQLVDQAKATDSKLGDIATDLTGKVQSLESALGGGDVVKSKLDGVLKSLTGGLDSEALTSAFSLVKSAKLTPEQLDLAKQVGNLTSAYVVQKDFSSLAGQQSDVATLVTALRGGHLKDSLQPIKNIAQNAKLTDTQKQLISTIGDKYAPGLSKVTGAVDSIKKLPGF